MNGQRWLGGLGLAMFCVLASACQSMKVRPESVVVVKDTFISDEHPWVSHFARHTFIEYREKPGAPWWRAEIPGRNGGIEHGQISDEEAGKQIRTGRRVRVLAQQGGDGSEIARQIKSLVSRYDDAIYRPWPGPNSNTFIETLLRETEGAHAVLDHNAVGKDYGWYLGPTAGGTGVEVQATFLGAAVGLREGVEVSVLGLGAGIGFWPPAIKIPVLPKLSTQW